MARGMSADTRRRGAERPAADPIVLVPTALPTFPWYALVDEPEAVIAVRVADPAGTADPVAPESASTVVGIGVLDRVRADDPGSTEARQLDTAGAVLELVRPGGVAWFSVQNRASVLHFAGVRPRHGYPFETLAPRRVQALLRRMLPTGFRLRPALLTRRGYVEMLTSAGFEDVHLLPAFFDADRPEFVATRHRNGALGHYLRTVRYSRSRRARVAIGALRALDRIGAFGPLAPAYVIRARRPTT